MRVFRGKCNWITAALFASCSVYATSGVASLPSEADDYIAIGLVQTINASPFEQLAEWQWALRGGGAVVRSLDLSRPLPGELKLIVVDDTPLGSEHTKALADWVAEGGLLLITSSRSLLSKAGMASENNAVTVPNKRMTRLAGIEIDYLDPGLMGSYPLLVKSDPLVAPFLQGDGLRLGLKGGG